MKEKDLNKLGFIKESVSAEESGDKPYYYYSLNFFDDYDRLELLSNSNDETENDEWWVTFLHEDRVRIKDRKQLETLISLLKSNI